MGSTTRLPGRGDRTPPARAGRGHGCGGRGPEARSSPHGWDETKARARCGTPSPPQPGSLCRTRGTRLKHDQAPSRTGTVPRGERRRRRASRRLGTAATAHEGAAGAQGGLGDVGPSRDSSVYLPPLSPGPANSVSVHPLPSDGPLALLRRPAGGPGTCPLSVLTVSPATFLQNGVALPCPAGASALPLPQCY